MTITTLDIGQRFGGIGLNRQAHSTSDIRDGKQINLILQDANKYTKPLIKPRQYQTELYKKALEGNTIIYLGTGLGKTFIVVMVLKSPLISEQITSGRRVIFLAPTQDLVKQQAEYIYRQVPYKVKVYCGRTCNAGQHIDNWSKEVWDAELLKQELLFMTPAILNQALAINALKWSSIALLVLDEVHHAATSKKEKSGKKSGSQYSQILKHYRHMYASSGQPSTRFLGLTASLINNMPKGANCIELGVCDLEAKLQNAKCITDLSAIESKPKHVIWSYTESEITESNDTLYALFRSHAKRYEEAMEIAKLNRMLLLGPKTEDEKTLLAYHNRLKLASSGFSIKPKSFHKVLKQLAQIRGNSGIWTMTNICYNLSAALDSHSKATCISDSIRPLYVEFGAILKKILTAVGELVGSNYTRVLLDYTQPKLLCLLDVLRREHSRMVDKTGPKETFSCIVFVKSRVEVVAICSWLIMVSQHIAGYDFIKANYAIGLAATMASKWSCITKRKSTEQSLMLEDFRRGNLNVIVTTSVLEEGIDLPVCSTVIRYDTADTFRVYVQSRGRARQRESSFIAVTKKSGEVKDMLDKYNDFEQRVKEVLKDGDQSRTSHDNRPPRKSLGGDHPDDDHEDFYKNEKAGIFITPANAKTILHMYCARLSRTCPYSDGLQFKRRLVDNMYETTLFFPPGCPIRDSIQGCPRRTYELADSSAVLAAFKALFDAGELDSHGVPLRATEEHIDQILAKCDMAPDFSSLGEYLEGDIVQHGVNYCHEYPWKIFNLTQPSFIQRSTGGCYKLYRITFSHANKESVRRETLHLFENSAYGLIIDATQDHSNLPKKILSHYGEFEVSYDLIDDSLRIESHGVNQKYFNYTFRLIRTFWNLPGFNRDSFAERCLFYLAPLDSSNNVDWARVENAFFIANDDFRPGDIVKINQFHSTRDNFSKRFLVNEVHTDMNAYSRIPECNETFKERLERQGGRLRDPRQPVVSVWPISRSHGKTSQSKKVRSDDTTRLNYYLWQSFERLKCDPHEAYQAYCLPVIVYQIYINALGAELEKQFMASSAGIRNDVILADVELQAEAISPVNGEDCSSQSEEVAQDASQSSTNTASIVSQDEMETPEQFALSDSLSISDFSDEEDSDYEFASQYGSDEDDDSSSDPDEPAPNKRYRDILAKQEFNLQQHDKTGLEKWDLSEYNVPDLKQQSVQYEASYHYPNRVDSDARASAILSLPEDTLNNQLKIEEILKQFAKGIRGDANFVGDDETYHREGAQVDLSIGAPIKFDKRTIAPDQAKALAFVEAITLRRASGDTNLEALENVGDSYLKYFISVLLFKYLDGNEGILTTARSRLVGNKHFYHLAKKNRLGYYAILHGFDVDVLNAIFGAKSSIKNRLRPKDMADMFESIIGACLVHGSEHEAILAMKWLGLDRIIREDAFREFHEFGVAFARHEFPRVDKNSIMGYEYRRQCIKQVAKFQSILKYDFNEPAYLLQAFTHASAFNRCTESYERLEFLGDAIIDFLVTMTLYQAGFTKDPGQLTSSRSALVNNNTFAKLAIKYKFDIYIIHANQQLFDELNRVNENIKNGFDIGFLDDVEFDRITKTLADVFEAVAGAVYLDSGCSLDTVYSLYYPMMKELIDEEIKQPTKNIVTRLFEMFPGKDRIKFEYYKATVGDEGDTVDCAKCMIHGVEKEFFGEGLNKRQAKLRAVIKAMDGLPTEEEKIKLDEQWDALMRQTRPKTDGGRGRGGHRGDRGGHRRGGHRGGSRGHGRRDNRGHQGGPPFRR